MTTDDLLQALAPGIRALIDTMRADWASVPAAETIVCPGATHSFLVAMSIADVSRRGIADGAALVARHLYR